MKRHQLFAAFLLLLITLFSAFPASAQGAISVIDSEARADFPGSITFRLSAESSAGRIVAVQLLYGPSRLEELTVVNAQFSAGEQVTASHLLDTQVYYVAPGTELTYRWLIRDEAGNQVETPAQELVYDDDRFPWQSRSERGVTVYWYRGGASFGDELIQTATRALDRLEQQIGATVEQQVKIYIYASGDDMRAALESNEVEWVGGQARPDLGLIIGAVAPGDVEEARRLIPHELSHQVLHQAVDNPYGGLPVWFDEGLAVYNQETPDVAFPRIVDRAARRGTLIPLEALASSFPADPDLAYQSYAQSHSLVAYLVKTYGAEKMAELVAAFRAATPVDQAVRQVLGLSVDELDAAWRQTLPAPEGATPTPAAGPASAPADRFARGPARPLPAAPPVAGEAVSLPLIGWLASGPGWLGLGLVAGGCVVLLAVTAVALLLALRLMGVGKRNA